MQFNGRPGSTIYYRGPAYLELNSGKEAETQFQRILNNPIFIANIYWPLARLGLARECSAGEDR